MKTKSPDKDRGFEDFLTRYALVVTHHAQQVQHTGEQVVDIQV